eukprot:4802099-Amphidinium_carterae.1
MENYSLELRPNLPPTVPGQGSAPCGFGYGLVVLSVRAANIRKQAERGLDTMVIMARIDFQGVLVVIVSVSVHNRNAMKTCQ